MEKRKEREERTQEWKENSKEAKQGREKQRERGRRGQTLPNIQLLIIFSLICSSLVGPFIDLRPITFN